MPIIEITADEATATLILGRAKAFAQIRVNLYIVPRLHSPGYFVGISMAKKLTTEKEIPALIEHMRKRMAECIGIPFGLLGP